MNLDINLSFGEALTLIMKNKGINLRSFADLLGYGSKTSLMRIIKNETSANNVKQCLKRIAASHILDENEMRDLAMIVCAQSMGMDRYRAWQSIWSLLLDQQNLVQSKSELLMQNAWDQLLEKCNHSDHVKILIMNCCWPEIFRKIGKALENHASVKIEHHFFLDDDMERTIRGTAVAIQQIERSPSLRVDSKAYRFGAINLDARIFTSELACAELTSGDTVDEYLLMQFPDSEAQLLKLDGGQGCCELFGNALSAVEHMGQSIIVETPEVIGVDDFVRQSEKYDRLEWKRNVYMIEPDLCMHCVSPDTIMRVLDVASVRQFISPDDNVNGLLLRFLRSHSKRYKNLFENRCVKQFVVSRRYIQSFALTGKFQVHFMAFRAFTISERIETLEKCLWHAENDPYFDLFFWDHDEEVPRHGYFFFESHGVLVFNGHPESDVRRATTYLLLKDAKAANLFCDYFKQVIIKEHVLPYREGVHFLRCLINDLRKMELVEAEGIG